MSEAKTKIRIAVLIAAPAVLLMAGGCSHSSGAAADNAADGPANLKAEVTLTRVAKSDIRETVVLTGTVAAPPNRDVKVSALVTGRIAQMEVAEGDRVRKGQVVARLEDHTYQNQLLQAEAAESQAKATYENAKLAKTRNEDLFKRGIAARKDLEDATTQESVAAGGLHQAEAALEIARMQVARTEIISPLDGIVAKRFVGIGEQVDGTAAQPVVEVANISSVELRGNLPAVYLSRIHAGQAIPVTSDSPPGKTFEGHILAISPSVDPATGVGLVRVGLANPGGVLRLGMFLSAQITIEDHPNALNVPPDAIYKNDKGERRVFRVEGETATAVPVEIGIENKDRVELLSGVKEGETVILTGGYGLGDTAKVQVKP